METKTSFRQAHLENQMWANELEFYREEITILQKHLNEMTSIHSSKAAGDRAQLLENQLARFGDQVNMLEAELNTAQAKMAAYAKNTGGADLESVNVADHYQFREKVEQFKKEYQQLKNEYRNFESEELH